MSVTSEDKISRLKSEIGAARSARQKCSLLIDMAMELRHFDPEAALEEAKKALAIAAEINFVLGKARSYFCIGLVHFNLSDYEQAFVFLDLAHHGFLEVGDKWGMSNALNNIGLIHFRLGDYTKALTHFSSSLEIKNESGDRFGMANVMISMAAIHRETGNPKEAKLLLTESLRISEGQKFNALIAKALTELGITLMIENQNQEAREKFERAKLFFEKQNNYSGIAQCLLQVAKMQSVSGDTGQAISLYEEGQKIAAKAGDKSLLSVFIFNIADEKLRSGKTDEAISLLHEARKIAFKTQEKPVQSIIANHLSLGYEASGNLKEALKEYKNFVALKEEINTIETATQLRNQEISGKVDALEKANKMLEVEKMAAIGELTSMLKTQEINSLNAMMEGQEKERNRIASDLHDRIGGSLAAIKLHLGSFVKSLGDSVGKESPIIKVNNMFDEVIKEVRQVSHDLASGVLVKFGLVSALKELSETIDGAGSINVSFFPAGFEKRVDHRIEIALYRVTQEIITNILKHAQAKEVSIHLSRFDEHLSLMVEDDGKGFDPEKASGGLGLSSIRSRINQLAGTILFDSSPGNGCTVTIEIPIPANI